MKILLIDDNDRFRDRLAQALRHRGHEVFVAGNSHEAAGVVSQVTHAVVDLRLGDEDGLKVLEDLLQINPSLVAVMLTGYGSIATTVDAIRLGAMNYLQKPADAEMVLAALAKKPLHESEEYEPPSLARAEWEHIQRVLVDCGGNISHAAKRLGLHRRTLQRKLQRYAPKK